MAAGFDRFFCILAIPFSSRGLVTLVVGSDLREAVHGGTLQRESLSYFVLPVFFQSPLMIVPEEEPGGGNDCNRGGSGEKLNCLVHSFLHLNREASCT